MNRDFKVIDGGKDEPAARDYIPPSRDEFQALFQRWKLTPGPARDILGLESQKTVRRWLHDDARVPFSVLYTLASEREDVIITPSGWRLELGIESE